MEFIHFFSNIISVIAAIITIVSACKSRAMLSELEKYKNERHKNIKNENIIMTIKKYKINIVQNIQSNGKSFSNTDIVSYVKELIKNDQKLNESCSKYIEIIDKIKNINNKNYEQFFINIDAIVDCYEKAKNI